MSMRKLVILVYYTDRYPLQQASEAPVSAAAARPLDTAPDIILSESFDHRRP
jgi:hypothetical protein